MLICKLNFKKNKRKGLIKFYGDHKIRTSLGSNKKDLVSKIHHQGTAKRNNTVAIKIRNHLP
ncbi:Uncharacterised protein [Sphingobacterium thalpophilum]|uniref:Uncharacterized protein n=1 Tax=Sphingobacterium thalpophilum TaxID=259 RepID=A0A4U9W533_9SPHI|nr:Uncharacterised protein [Sphingobacterium thalpophilum]